MFAVYISTSVYKASGGREFYDPSVKLVTACDQLVCRPCLSPVRGDIVIGDAEFNPVLFDVCTPMYSAAVRHRFGMLLVD